MEVVDLPAAEVGVVDGAILVAIVLVTLVVVMVAVVAGVEVVEVVEVEVVEVDSRITSPLPWMDTNPQC